MNEQVLLKMGMDHKGVQTALGNVSQSVKNWSNTTKNESNAAGEAMERGFVKGTSAGKGFKKLLGEVAETSPVMGNALKLAISPIGGMFAIAAAGIGYATAALAKFNESLDITGKLNAKAVTFGPGSKWAQFFKSLVPGQEIADFEKGQRDKNDPQGTREDLISQAMVAEREWKNAVNNKGGGKVRQGIEDAKRVIESLKEKIADAERTMPQDASRADIQSGSMWWSAIKGDSSGAAEARQKHQAYVDAQTQLKSLKDLLAQNEDTLLKLDDADKEHTKTIAEKRQALDKLLDAIRKLPPAQAAAAAAVAPVPGIAPVSNLDPHTGGIAYRPLKGALGYVDPTKVSTPATQTAADIKTVSQHMEKLVAMASGEGLRIIPKNSE